MKSTIAENGMGMKNGLDSWGAEASHKAREARRSGE